MKMIRKHLDKNHVLYDNQDLIDLVGPIDQVSRYHMVQYERDYDVFLIEGPRGSVIYKTTESENEVKVLRHLAEGGYPGIPDLYRVFQKEGAYDLIMAYVDGQDREPSLETYKEVLDHLSQIHLSDRDQGTIRRWSPLPLEELQLLQGDLDVQGLVTSQRDLDKSYKTLIHGDLIPLNIIHKDHGSYIIDWEYGEYSPIIRDISRLLGDINVNRKWVDPAYEEDLLDYYYDLIKDKSQMSRKDFDRLYLAGKIDNYLGPLLSFKLRKREPDAWYRINLEAAKACLDSYKEM